MYEEIWEEGVIMKIYENYFQELRVMKIGCVLGINIGWYGVKRIEVEWEGMGIFLWCVSEATSLKNPLKIKAFWVK